ncbi:hypothetical protein [Zooshikella harenae]|uniref:Tail fiber assembly protein n=1 Tax=Zooshikella harenae TaxID=2827238 RepID=A0ABS5ZIH4_9GAMM|nr:hypothetical protein [Zooshikella harenae]MBU2713789.1 hypothetical protein [Zooshikella harenae]
MMNTIYNYHPLSGEYLSQVEAHNDPLEGKPLVPAYATTKRPPLTQQNEVALFKNGFWSIVSDYRGVEYWLPDGTYKKIQELDQRVPANALTEPPEPSLGQLRRQVEQKVVAFAFETRAKVSEHVDQYKLASWNDKAQRALRILSNNASEADKLILQAECDKRGSNETLQQLAQKQVVKNQSLAMACAIIDGAELKALKEIKSKRSEKTLNALFQNFKNKVNDELKTYAD